MTWFGIFFISIVFDLLLDKNYGTCDFAARPEAQTCYGQEGLAFAQEGHQKTQLEAAASGSDYAAVAPL
jgi:hypothetical protein